MAAVTPHARMRVLVATDAVILLPVDQRGSAVPHARSLVVRKADCSISEQALDAHGQPLPAAAAGAPAAGAPAATAGDGGAAPLIDLDGPDDTTPPSRVARFEDQASFMDLSPTERPRSGSPPLGRSRSDSGATRKVGGGRSLSPKSRRLVQDDGDGDGGDGGGDDDDPFSVVPGSTPPRPAMPEEPALQRAEPTPEPPVVGEGDEDGRVHRDQVVYGCLGLAHLCLGSYLVLVSQSQLMGNLHTHSIFKVQKVFFFAVSRTREPFNADDQLREDTLLRMMASFLESGFYFSHTLDLTCRIQAWAARRRKGPAVFRDTLDRRFFWNRHLAAPLVDAQLDRWILPVVQGFVQIERQQLAEHSFTLAFISRRNSHRTGTRYHARGIDLLGNVANNVETEQIVERNGAISSYLIVRGSIPLLWQQNTTQMQYAPRPQLSDADLLMHRAFAQHVQQLVGLYGKIVAIDLVNSKGAEGTLGSCFGKYAEMLRSPDFEYVAFDFHQVCKNSQYGNLSILRGMVADARDTQGFYFSDEAGKDLMLQKSVFRVNCIDCLDRTNVVQSMFAEDVLSRQLVAAGIIQPNDQDWWTHPPLYKCFKDIWANNADALSLQYSGTGALKVDFTRTGKRNVRGLLNDGMRSIKRYYFNNFKDEARQDCIDLLLGRYTVHRSLPAATDAVRHFHVERITSTDEARATNVFLAPDQLFYQSSDGFRRTLALSDLRRIDDSVHARRERVSIYARSDAQPIPLTFQFPSCAAKIRFVAQLCMAAPHLCTGVGSAPLQIRAVTWNLRHAVPPQSLNLSPLLFARGAVDILAVAVQEAAYQAAGHASCATHWFSLVARAAGDEFEVVASTSADEFGVSLVVLARRAVAERITAIHKGTVVLQTAQQRRQLQQQEQEMLQRQQQADKADKSHSLDEAARSYDSGTESPGPSSVGTPTPTGSIGEGRARPPAQMQPQMGLVAAAAAAVSDGLGAAAAVSLKVDDTSMCFVSVHFNDSGPLVSEAARAEAYASLMRDLPLQPKRIDLPFRFDATYVLGSFGYRCPRRDFPACETWTDLVQNDPLTMLLTRGNALGGLSEAPISFGPSCPVVDGAVDPESDAAGWASRVLFAQAPMTDMRPGEYGTGPALIGDCEHLPVLCDFALPTMPLPFVQPASAAAGATGDLADLLGLDVAGPAIQVHEAPGEGDDDDDDEGCALVISGLGATGLEMRDRDSFLPYVTVQGASVAVNAQSSVCKQQDTLWEERLVVEPASGKRRVLEKRSLLLVVWNMVPLGDHKLLGQGHVPLSLLYDALDSGTGFVDFKCPLQLHGRRAGELAGRLHREKVAAPLSVPENAKGKRTSWAQNHASNLKSNAMGMVTVGKRALGTQLEKVQASSKLNSLRSSLRRLSPSGGTSSTGPSPRGGSPAAGSPRPEL